MYHDTYGSLPPGFRSLTATYTRYGEKFEEVLVREAERRVCERSRHIGERVRPRIFLLMAQV